MSVHTRFSPFSKRKTFILKLKKKQVGNRLNLNSYIKTFDYTTGMYMDMVHKCMNHELSSRKL